MTATTTAYLELQHVYREQADADVAAVEAHAGRILAAQGRSPTAVPHAAVRSFCKNARNIRWGSSGCDACSATSGAQEQKFGKKGLMCERRVLRYRTLAEEVGATNGNSSARGAMCLVLVW